MTRAVKSERQKTTADGDENNIEKRGCRLSKPSLVVGWQHRHARWRRLPATLDERGRRCVGVSLANHYLSRTLAPQSHIPTIVLSYARRLSHSFSRPLVPYHSHGHPFSLSHTIASRSVSLVPSLVTLSLVHSRRSPPLFDRTQTLRAPSEPYNDVTVAPHRRDRSFEISPHTHTHTHIHVQHTRHTYTHPIHTYAHAHTRQCSTRFFLCDPFPRYHRQYGIRSREVRYHNTINVHILFRDTVAFWLCARS